MMIMEGSNTSKKISDLKAIMYSAYDKPHKLCNISGNYTIRQPKLPPNNAGRPMRQFKSPPRLVQVESWVTPCSICFFFVRGEPAWGGKDFDAEIHYTLAAPGNITGTASINHCSCASEVTLNDMGKWKLNGRSLSYTPNNPSTTPPYVYFMEYIVLGSDISFLDSQLCIFWNCSSFL